MTGVVLNPRAELGRLLEEDPADLYENAPMGYLSTLPDGVMVKVNRTLSAWTGLAAEELLGRRLQELLTVGGRVYYETHMAPLLRMQGAVREIALDVVRRDGSVLPCLLNAVEVRDEAGRPVLVRATLFEARARRRYEQELLAAQRTAEESEARTRTVQRVVSDLAAATSVDEVASVVVAHSRAATLATSAALVLIEDADDPAHLPVLRLARSEGLSAELVRTLQEAAGERLALELAEGVRTVRLDDRLREVQPAVAAAMAADGLAALTVVPVTADSRRLGLLLLGAGATRPGDLISLDDPATVRDEDPAEGELLETLGRQAGQALERARLLEETARQAERAAFLLEAARLLAEAPDVAETVERLAQLAVERLADVCAIDLVTEQGLVRPAARHSDPARHELAAQLRARHLPTRGLPHPSVQALETGRTHWVRTVDDEFLRSISLDEEHLALLRRMELTSMVAVPLTADGRRLGVVTLGVDRRRPAFTAADVEVAEQLGLQVSLVVAKAQRYETEVRTSHELQASLLPPPPPAVPGLAIAVRYLAATHGVDVGGDFYDVLTLPEGPVALAVGDVVGHDLTAAATMGQLTSVYRALLVDRPSPSALIDRLQASWSLLGLQRMATALFASLDPATGQLRVASAGHLPPLLLTDGHADVLPVRPSRLLGAPPAPAPALEWAGVVPVGATLLLFTDGLVESRSADLDEGLAALLSVCAEMQTADPDELCDRLLAELTGEHRADDIALLAITRQPSA
jgi:serine/threonine-protein kinase RsbW